MITDEQIKAYNRLKNKCAIVFSNVKTHSEKIKINE